MLTTYMNPQLTRLDVVTTEEHVLINRYRTPGGSEMEVFITSRIPFVNMVGTGLDMGYMKSQLLEHKLNHYGFKQF